MSLRRALVVFALCALAAFARADDFNITVAAPVGCHGNKCKLNLTVIPTKDGAEVMMEAEAKQYVAVALAGSGMMGIDPVIECVKSNKSDNPIDFYHSSNAGPPTTPGRDNKRDDKQAIDTVTKNRVGAYKDGRVFCSFLLSNSTKFPKQTIDLSKNRYFLQVVSGDAVDDKGLRKHSQWAITLRAVSLKKDEGKIRTADNVPPPKECSASTLATSGLALTMALILKAWI